MIGTVIIMLALLALIAWLCYKLESAYDTTSGPLVIKIGSAVLLRAETIGEMSHVVDCYLRIRSEAKTNPSTNPTGKEQFISPEESLSRIVGGYIAGYRQAEADNGKDDGTIPLSFVNLKAREWAMNPPALFCGGCGAVDDGAAESCADHPWKKRAQPQPSDFPVIPNYYGGV